jgi:hypothetical protein
VHLVTDPVLTPLEIYKLLPRSNCGKCRLPSCLAFAAALSAGRQQPADCPDLAPAAAACLAERLPHRENREMDQAEFMAKLRRKMGEIDAVALAPRLGAILRDGKLAIRSLGKEFLVDARGVVSSECHIIPWVEAPLLSYITHKSHGEITGRWLSFREFKGGIEWQGLFSSRCETPLRLLADAHPELLSDIIDLFQGRTIEWYQADIALVLHPLPKVPILICYQAPEEDLDSVLNIFFDECCGVNLHIRSIFTLCSGLVQMFAKIAEHHR